MIEDASNAFFFSKAGRRSCEPFQRKVCNQRGGKERLEDAEDRCVKTRERRSERKISRDRRIDRHVSLNDSFQPSDRDFGLFFVGENLFEFPLFDRFDRSVLFFNLSDGIDCIGLVVFRMLFSSKDQRS